MKVKRKAEKKKIPSKNEKLARLGTGYSMVALAGSGKDYLSYKKNAKAALNKALQSGIDSPAIDVTKESVKDRIKRISKNDWKTLKNMQRGARENILEKKIAKEALETAYDIPQKYKDKMKNSISASESIKHKVDAAANLKDAKTLGRCALAVGIPSVGYLAYKKYQNYKNNKKKN